VNVLARDGFRCCYCGQTKSARELNYDHVVPRHQGGRTVWENIVAACFACNSKKANRTPVQAGMKMHFRPHKPQVLPMRTPLILDKNPIPTQWVPFLSYTNVIRSRMDV
jgi:5-methylcytosine-specific restriction endonuclease McrA